MTEKRKYIRVPAWVENAVNIRRRQTRRSWQGEAVMLIEDYLTVHLPEIAERAKRETA